MVGDGRKSSIREREREWKRVRRSEGRERENMIYGEDIRMVGQKEIERDGRH